jgi:hypothetical protein
MGCCIFTLALFGASRLANVVWWLFRPAYWFAAWQSWPVVWWMWPTLGILFLPWTTLMYMVVYPDGLSFVNWLFLGFALVVDIGSYGSGFRANAART